MSSESISANQQVARAASTVMIAMIISQIVSLAASMIIARVFGTQHDMDAFYAANRVSETLFVLVAAGALSSSFIPAFTSLLVKEEKQSAWRLGSAVANLLLLILSLLAGLAALFAPQIVRYALAPGFTDDAGLFTLTVDLLRLQLVSVVLFGLGGLVGAILNSHQKFFIPALTPAMYRIGLIIGAAAFKPLLGIYGLAWGVVLGSALYLLIQIPSLIRLRGEYSLTFGIRNPAVGEVARLMGPRIFGVAVVQLNFWVNTWLASQMDEGSLSAVTFGYALMLMAQAAIAQSVAIAAMPTLSKQFALGKIDEFRATLTAGLRGVILFSLPASVGLILLRQPIVSMLYEGGQFSIQSTEMVAWSLLWYAAGLVGHAVLEVLARAFYALHDTKTPVLVGAGAMTINVVLSFLFSALFDRIGWMPHGGLALANSTATAMEAILLFLLMRRRIKSIRTNEIGRGFFQAVICVLGMTLSLWLWSSLMTSTPVWIFALGGVVVGFTAYGLMAVLLRIPEFLSLVHSLRQRLGL